MSSGRALLALGFILTATGIAQDSGNDFFEKKVRPVFVARCQMCHNAQLKTAGLDLSSAHGFQQGGQSGALISPNERASSLLLKVISYEERMKMPPTGKLDAEEIAALTEWVEAGAPWPGAAASASPAAPAVRTTGRIFTESEKNWWAFQPVRAGKPPAVRNSSWIATPVDRFILAKLEARGLKPAPPADKLTLLRRLTFDLTGLPPGEPEIAAFLADTSAEAYAKVVERLLASPRYGERWGRHWLDLARYADSTGNDEDHRYPHAWRYRDYVIDAFNSDLPYDQFIREQIAGDLLPSAAPNELNKRGIIATGFLALGAKAIAQQDKKKMLYDVYDEQVDVVSKTFLGLTVACARCHDHKFDPILTRDYYSMIAFFANTRSFEDPEPHVSKLFSKPLVPPEALVAQREYEQKMRSLAVQIDEIVEQEKERLNQVHRTRLADYMVAARTVYADGAALSEAALRKGLSDDVLKKWVEYLKPSPGKVQPHLEEWRKATGDTAMQVAAVYQARYLQRSAEWSKRIAAWRTGLRQPLETGIAPRGKPSFQAESDPFFNDVYIEESGPFSVRPRDQDRVFSADAKGRIADLRALQAELKKNAPPEPEMACAVEDLSTQVKQHVFIRGDYGSLGEEVSKGYPTILARATDPAPAPTGSGRMALADWLASQENPLTARVMANRIWQWHFGEGLARTSDNFGKMGEPPTHPELLDWLASEFVRSGWSIKAMHRTIVLSATYRMSSNAAKETLAADPENRLWSRFQRRRLDVEEIRDSLLALDGSLDLTMGGTLQSGTGTDGENSAQRLSLRPEVSRRRTVYLPLRRANLPALLNLFDFGDATTVGGKRARTNVAPQALFMLNSDFLTERSRGVAEPLLKQPTITPAARLEQAYLRILNRKPAPQEVDSGLTYISEFSTRFAASDLAAWQSLCRALMASNDFIYVD